MYTWRNLFKFTTSQVSTNAYHVLGSLITLSYINNYFSWGHKGSLWQLIDDGVISRSLIVSDSYTDVEYKSVWEQFCARSK